METVLEPRIDVTNINEKIYDFLKKHIVNFTYPPGYKLNVRQLRKELGVSQTPIKDALFRLAGEGLVEISSRRGTFVKEVTDQDITELYDTRMILEAGAGESIAKNITDQQLDELERLYEGTLRTDANTDYRIFMEREKEFHLAIIRFTKNKRLLNIYNQLNPHMQAVRFRFGEQALGRLPKTNQEHESILNSFKKRDPLRVKEAIKHHLSTGKGAFLAKVSHDTTNSLESSKHSEQPI